MADDTTKIIISIETLLRGLDKTLRGLDQVKKQLDAIGNLKSSSQGADRAVLAAQKLALQQQRLLVQSQELANRQERARRTTEQLARSQEKLAKSQKAVSDAGAQSAKILEAARRRREAEDARQRTAAESLQRQRSGAIIQQFRAQEREQERARKSVLTLDQALGRVGGSLRNLGLGLTSLGASLSVALSAPLTALGVLATRNAVTLDSLKRGLTAIVGSAEEAGQQLSRLTQIAKLPGIGFQEAIQGSIRLQAVGFSAEVAEKALREFSNAVALTGGGRDELNRITVQLGQLSAKGKVLSQDLKPIIEAGPAVGRALKEAFGTVNAEDIQALGLSSEEFLDRLIQQLGQLPRAAAGLRNTFDNFADSVFRASAAIGEAIIPVLTRLVNIAEPVINVLAAAFKGLSPITQTLIVAFGALLAAAGPLLFIFGQLATGIGGLISAFGRLHALGLLPTIKGFQLLSQVMRGTASLAAGQAATTAAAAAGWLALGGAVAIAATALVLIGGAIASYVSEQNKAVKISEEQIRATQEQIDSLEKQAGFIDSLAEGVERTAAEQEKLAEIYSRLNTEAKIRVTGITDEEKRLGQLREELERLLRLRREEQIQQAANLATSLARTAQQVTAGERERESITERVKANSELIDIISRSSRITVEQSKQLARQGISASSAQDAIGALNAENESLIKSQTELIASGKELNGTAAEQAATLKSLQEQTGLSARELLEAAKAMGIFKGNVEAALESMEIFLRQQGDLASTANRATSALLDQAGAFIALGKAAEKSKQADEEVVKGMLSFFSSIAKSRAEFDRLVDDALSKFPELRAAIERLRKDGSFADAFNDLIGKSKRGAGTGLRNAQEQLAKALEGIALAGAERERSIERDKNDSLLQENENSFRLRLVAYREYLKKRALLARANLEIEIREQEQIVTSALAEQQRFLERSKRNIPAAERTRAQAEAAEAEQRALEAGTRVLELRSRQGEIDRALAQALAESQQRQLEDIRQLEIEYAELQGRIESAMKAATVERFREELEALGRAQEDINKRLREFGDFLSAEQKRELEAARATNQRQIEAIDNQIAQRDALAELAAAQQLVTNAKERQQLLERDLTFQVEFRGLREEDAIRQRLAGEERLHRSLQLSKSIIEATLQSFVQLGKTPPPELRKFIDSITDEIKGLGELPFTEQFRLIEKEFDRLNDERLRRIADVERAIRERDIAEVEGMLIIRRINGEYSADLERQVELLKQIAAQSNDASLQRQAQAAEQTAKDANSQLADFNRQLRSTSIDALRDGFTDFFASLGDNTTTAKEKLLNLIDSVVARINQVIAENISEKLIESLFGSGGAGGEGIISAVGRLLGIGGGGRGATGGAGGAVASAAGEQTGATAAATTLTTGATAAATALTTGGTAAGAALTAGGATASATLVSSLTAAAASFSAAVIAAGTAFAAAVAAAAATQTATSGLAGLSGGAATGLFPAQPGGVYRIVEGGYPEAVITTDPHHAARQVGILRELIQRTKGFYGRVQVPDFAIGGWASREAAEANLLNSISRAPSSMPHLPDAAHAGVGGGGLMNLRIVNQVESRALTRPYINSEEGVRDIMNIISKNSNQVSRRLGR